MARGKKPKDEEHKPEEQPAREPTPEEIKDCRKDPEDAEPEEAAESTDGQQLPCPHGSHDGQACCALDCHVADVPGAIASLLRRKRAADNATVEFDATFKGGVMSDEGELKVTLVSNVADPWGLHRDQFVGHKGRQVMVFLAFAAEEPDSEALPGQAAMDFEAPQQPEPIEVVACAVCFQIDRTDGAEPGRVCPFCLNGETVLVGMVPLYCSECRQPAEFSTAKPGDTCTLCKEGRYLAGVAPVVDACGELVRFVGPDRVDEIADAVCGLALQNDQEAKAIVTVGDDRFVVTEITGSDPITWEAWSAVPMDEFDGDYHENGAETLEHLRVTLGEDGAAFVLVGPPVRILVQPEEEPEAEEQPETGDEPIEGQAD